MAGRREVEKSILFFHSKVQRREEMQNDLRGNFVIHQINACVEAFV